MQIYSITDKGKVRSTNEDAFYTSVLSDGTVFAVVCDGMGGANAGNIASETAASSIKRYIETAYIKNLSSDGKTQLLQNAILSANIEIFSMSRNDEKLKGMGTTVVAVIADEKNAVICHVGDSRAYLVNEDVVQLTKDHSVVQSLIESGKLTAEQAKTHPKKNIITRALGVEENVLADCSVIDFPENSHLILCSDGLSNYTDNKFIKKTFENNNGKDTAALLLSEANRNGGGDNITVVVISNVRKGK